MANQLTAERELFAACREWHRLAEAEGEAIRTGNWNLCAACQEALQNLRHQMTALMPAVRAEWTQAGSDRLARQELFDDTVRQLIRLERRNQARLKAVRTAAHAKIQQLHQAKIQLKQLRHSYGISREPALISYS